MPQSRLAKFHHAHRRYWEKVEASLRDQYHREPEVAAEWATDEEHKLEDLHGEPVIPGIPPERTAQEIFMERIEI